MKTRQRYLTDLTQAQKKILTPLLPAPAKRGRPREHDLLEIMNAIFFVLHTGCQWRQLPRDFPPYQTVYHYFRLWRKSGQWETWNTALREQVRRKAKREPTPSGAILDSQSVKTTEVGGPARGFDGAKGIHGRKRFILVDTMGLLLLAVVQAASVAERAGAQTLLKKAVEKLKLTRMKKLWMDGGFSGVSFADRVLQVYGWLVEIVKRSDTAQGFEVLPRRWVVERTFAWLTRNRRLSKDYERLPETGEAFMYAAMIRLMLKRLA